MAKGRPQNSPYTFWQNVRIDRRPGACWEWTLSTKNGYGRFTVNCVEHYAHRYAYALVNGSAPKGRTSQVMHKCNNKLCCRPDHLIVGTGSQNTTDAYRDGLIPSGERHAKAIHSDEVIKSIRDDPRPQLELARVYGVSQSHISRIKTGVSRG
jgi:hypothetical protein